MCVGLQQMCYKKSKQKARSTLYLSFHIKKEDLMQDKFHQWKKVSRT